MKKILLTFAALTLPLSAADWLQFRGTAVNGIATEGNPPVAFDASSIAWKTALPGRGLSSPVIVGDRIFLTAASGPKQETLHLICLRAADGRQLWERTFQATGRTMCHEKTCNAAPTPCSDGKHFFALFSSNDLICTDLDGNLKWLRGLTVDYPNASNSLGLSSSLLVADGVLIAQVENDSDSFTAGLEVTTGENKWKIPGKKMANWTSPALITDPGAPATVVLVDSDATRGVDPQTGRTRWTLESGGSIASATVHGAHMATPRGRGVALWSLKGGTTPPEMVWESPQVSADTASPLILGDRVYAIGGAGALICADLKTGERPWKLRLDGKFSGSPVAAGTTIYAVSEQGILQSIDTTAPEGNITGKLELEETILCTPSLAGNSIYVRSDGHVWRVGK